jgi:septal ring factor EnvC (AmiA/AmiB activator)
MFKFSDDLPQLGKGQEVVKELLAHLTHCSKRLATQEDIIVKQNSEIADKNKKITVALFISRELTEQLDKAQAKIEKLSVQLAYKDDRQARSDSLETCWLLATVQKLKQSDS